ncbi:MAG: hypothetical protein ACREMB_21975 [Candidatus Rokuibacteriota bacterium]
MTSAGRAAAALLLAWMALGATPALAAEQSARSLLIQWIAMGVMVAGGLAFFAWVAWLAFRR